MSDHLLKESETVDPVIPWPTPLGEPCRCGTTRMVRVRIEPSLSHTGKARWCKKEIDFCVADIVEALQRAGINMRSSCCGHGSADGEILLADGRVLRVENPKYVLMQLS